MNRLVIVPNPQLEAAGVALKATLSTLVSEVNANNMIQLMGLLAHRTLSRVAAEADGTELILWARDGRDFTVAWTSAVTGDKLEGHARAANEEGLIARVYESHRSTSEATPHMQTADWTNLERIRGTVSSMAASPVIAFETCIGVLCRVRYLGTDASEISPPAEGAGVLSRLIEDRLIRLSLGLEST
jgi:hypothetical protein